MKSSWGNVHVYNEFNLKTTDDFDTELILENLDLDEDIPIIIENLFLEDEEENVNEEVKICEEDIETLDVNDELNKIPTLVFVNEDDILVHVDESEVLKKTTTLSEVMTKKIEPYKCDHCGRPFKKEGFYKKHKLLCGEKGNSVIWLFS